MSCNVHPSCLKLRSDAICCGSQCLHLPAGHGSLEACLNKRLLLSTALPSAEGPFSGSTSKIFRLLGFTAFQDNTLEPHSPFGIGSHGFPEPAPIPHPGSEKSPGLLAVRQGNPDPLSLRTQNSALSRHAAAGRVTLEHGKRAKAFVFVVFLSKESQQAGGLGIWVPVYRRRLTPAKHRQQGSCAVHIASPKACSPFMVSVESECVSTRAPDGKEVSKPLACLQPARSRRLSLGRIHGACIV